MVTTLALIPKVDGKSALEAVKAITEGIADVGLSSLIVCGPPMRLELPGKLPYIIYVEWYGSSTRGILRSCIPYIYTTPILVVRGSRPYVSPLTYRLMVDAWRLFKPPIVIPSRGGRGISSPILISTMRRFRLLAKLNERLKLSGSMVKFLILSRRDVFMVEVDDTMLNTRLG